MPNTSLERYRAFHARSLESPDEFWLEEARKIDWAKMPEQAIAGDPPHSVWFPDGETNLCSNAVDRWAARQGDANALIHVSGETGDEYIYSYNALLGEVNAWAAALMDLDVAAGDRVLIYMPMIPEAVFAMLACTRIGAIHAVVFGGFASGALAARIDDAEPKVIVTADAGLRSGQTVPYRPLLEGALAEAAHAPDHVVTVDRGLFAFEPNSDDVDAASIVESCRDRFVAPVALPSSHPSYILYTSGTTGKPKGVQRDTGGYAVALQSSMDHIFRGARGDTMLTASDIGWVVGHSYIVYAPLLAGMATVLFEGTPTYPDPGVLWRIVEKHRVNRMFTSPTGLRVLRKSGETPLAGLDLSSLETLFVAGEPLDADTAGWWMQTLGAQIVDNYWQTETGWPILARCTGIDDLPAKPGSPGPAVYGYDARVVNPATGKDAAPGEKGLLALALPLPPGTLTTLWRNDAHFEKTYFSAFDSPKLYSTFDWATRDEDGYVTILGRSDDIINVAGHRLGTREIEDVLNAHRQIGESAVIGVADPVKGEVPVAFIVTNQTLTNDEIDKAAINSSVRNAIGPIASLHSIHVVDALPKTRSGKIMRRLLKAICEGTDLGELTSIDNPTIVESIRESVLGST